MAGKHKAKGTTRKQAPKPKPKQETPPPESLPLNVRPTGDRRKRFRKD